MEIHGEMGEEGLDPGLTLFQIVPGAHLVKQDIPFYPRTIATFGTDGVVPAPHGATHFIQQFCGHRSHSVLMGTKALYKVYCILQTGKSACLYF